MGNLSVDEYIAALEKMKNSPRDRLGTFGELSGLAIGATGGYGISGTLAAAAGVTKIPFLTKGAAFLGVTAVQATPIGWIVTSMLGGAALAFLAVKSIKSGQRVDLCKAQTIQELEETVSMLQSSSESKTIDDGRFSELISAAQISVFNGKISQEKSTEVLTAVFNQDMSAREAFELLKSLLKEHEC